MLENTGKRAARPEFYNTSLIIKPSCILQFKKHQRQRGCPNCLRLSGAAISMGKREELGSFMRGPSQEYA